jgi:hypothetical protein
MRCHKIRVQQEFKRTSGHLAFYCQDETLVQVLRKLRYELVLPAYDVGIKNFRFFVNGKYHSRVSVDLPLRFMLGCAKDDNGDPVSIEPGVEIFDD